MTCTGLASASASCRGAPPAVVLSSLSSRMFMVLTHHVHILEMNGESYRLAQSKRRSRRHSETPLTAQK
jgi:hypothetical protein